MSIENTLIDELNTSENTGDIIPSVPIDLIIAQALLNKSNFC
ncbi:hypothetical protein V4B84_28285 [Klebsiella pneumoniae]|nr:hypothetical protein [Klebsiella pneumoniae]MDW3758144.1 hypothetical protein [Klebsiella pneumoniae]MDW3766710.1 hypothetical protein [Klebsiella pneumoniae]